jgi:nucleotide-binding universal stress UspA family protein
VLLASHGTPGARAADRAAIDLCVKGGTLFHLTVVPDFWKCMMGDDWLNNVSTRDTYAKHVESELAREIDAHCRELACSVQSAGLGYECKTVLGKPAECLIAWANDLKPDLIVIGSPRPKGHPGVRSRMHLEALTAALGAPLLVIPHAA